MVHLSYGFLHIPTIIHHIRFLLFIRESVHLMSQLSLYVYVCIYIDSESVKNNIA
ncbi:hypothetical protein HanRHA438_Chr11g0522231 [Helianthus annuus]|nr:hypothetical protein HanRHA438_Chr11g0522231 [Helianthus annuus]